MTPTTEFLNQVSELFAELGTIRWRKMFGGAGLYADDFFFALVDDGYVFFKGDSTNEPWFIAQGSQKFTYPGEGGQPVEMNYWRAPSGALKDPAVAVEWGTQGLDAAKRAKAPKKRRPSP